MPKGVYVRTSEIHDKIRFSKNLPIEERRRAVGIARSNSQVRCQKRYRAIWREILHGLGVDKCSICGYDRCFYAIDYHHTGKKKRLYQNCFLPNLWKNE